MRILLILLLAAAPLCFPAFAGASQTVMSVEWYKRPENKAVMEAKLKECKENPELRARDKNCQNAADASVLGGSFQKVKEPAIPKF